MTRHGGQDRMEYLDVARAVAAGAVLVEHALLHRVPGYDDWSTQFANVGRAGVVLFFAISGFIIPLSIERGRSATRFWWRRVFRLYPAYWLSVALGYAYLRCGGVEPLGLTLGDTRGWLMNLTMAQGFVDVPDVWPPYWTLRLELLIYVGCTLLFLFRLFPYWRQVVLCAIVGYAAYGIVSPLVGGKPEIIGSFRFMLFTPLLGLVAQRYAVGQLSRRGAYAFVVGHLLSVVAVWAVNRALFPTRVSMSTLNLFLLEWAPAYAVLFGLVELRRYRMPAAATWFGRISYSAYLLHPLVIFLLQPLGLPVWVMVPAVVVGTTLFAQVTYALVEKPGIDLGRRLEGLIWPRKKPVAAPVPEAVARPSF